jgi:GTPase
VRPVIVISIDEDLAEMEGLIETLGYEVEECVVQHRHHADPATFLGSGRVASLGERLKEGHPMVSGGAWLVVVNAELRPSQVFNLEEALKVEVWDRIRVILEIFRAKASVKEARLQVELAQMRYDLPFVHEAIHRQRTGERQGFMGGGELEARTYETHIKRRVKKITGELEAIKAERRQRRASRRRQGFRLAAIAGYTNAGKSQLLNTLCEEGAAVDSRYFSTLATRTRRLRPEYAQRVGGNLLFTDTVGFIRGLPPWLIDAFSSTLEEVAHADALLLVVDMAEGTEVVVGKLTAALEILEAIHATHHVLILLNKKDKLSQEQAYAKLDRLRMEPALTRYPFVMISGQKREGMEELLDTIWGKVVAIRTVEVELDGVQGAHLAFENWMHEHTQVLERSVQGTRHHLKAEVAEDLYGELLRQAQRIGLAIRSRAST